ncbi:MAG: class I SAM-dependent methyltransferase [Deltaproteobacteria bacterium]|jgi:2-polyprenyl-3-methyl-5-hydroxy-6-metoxy-1,4-benzoquinol methylase|nr:class I SAM-dependent methyltransferase [Deltaproteobacteria bacterium]
MTNDNNLQNELKIIANDYSNFFNGKIKFVVKFRPYNCPFTDIIPVIEKKYDSILDIGCGHGLFLYYCYRIANIKNAIGIDINEKLLSTVSFAFTNITNNVNYSFKQADSYRSWPKTTFDIVSMIDLLHHLNKKDHLEFVKEAAERVNKGGLFIIKDMLNVPFICGLTNTLNDLILSRQLPNYPNLDLLINTISGNFIKLIDKNIRTILYKHRLIILQRK